MTLLIHERYQMPVYLPDRDEMSDDEFYKFCQVNSHLRIERDENKNILIMPPVGGETGNTHSDIVTEIALWNRKSSLGKTFDSSTGFSLPDGSTRSPDAGWMKKESWDRLTSAEKKGFVPIAPDFVVEVLSPSDKLVTVQKKMKKWLQNGTQLGWLIAPKEELTFIYRADGSQEKIEGFDIKLSGENVLPGFEFDLLLLKDQ